MASPTPFLDIINLLDHPPAAHKCPFNLPPPSSTSNGSHQWLAEIYLFTGRFSTPWWHTSLGWTIWLIVNVVYDTFATLVGCHKKLMLAEELLRIVREPNQASVIKFCMHVYHPSFYELLSMLCAFQIFWSGILSLCYNDSVTSIP